MPRRDWLEAGLIALAALVLYAVTAPRTVALEDDGLFVLGAYFLGIGHPPGYPLFMLVGKLFTYLPFGSVAYRVHLVSAFFGGLTCSGSLAPPVSRFHSSNVSAEIFPFTSSSANLRRCA